MRLKNRLVYRSFFSIMYYFYEECEKNLDQQNSKSRMFALEI